VVLFSQKSLNAEFSQEKFLLLKRKSQRIFATFQYQTHGKAIQGKFEALL